MQSTGFFGLVLGLTSLAVVVVQAFVKPYDDGCHWIYDVVDGITLVPEANLSPLKPFVNSTSWLNQSIKCDYLNDRHNLKGEEDESEIINMGLGNSHPRVVMRLPTYDATRLTVTRRIFNDLEGVLVQITDPIQLQGKAVTDPVKLLGRDVDGDKRFTLTGDGKPEYPYATWLVPIPATWSLGRYSLDVTLHSPRVGIQRKQEHFMLFYDYYKTTTDPAVVAHFNMTPIATTVDFSSPTTAPNSIYPKMNFNTANTFPMPFLLDTTAPDTLLYTPDEGRTFYRYTFAAPSGATACGSETTFKILSHAVVPQRILLGTTFGLLQILSIDGMVKYPKSLAQSVILNKCVQTIVLPQINNVKGPFLTVITDTEILQASFFTTDGSYEFNTMTTLTDACTAINALRTSGDSTCIFKSAFKVYPTSTSFSVQLTASDHTFEMCLVKYAFAANATVRTWTLRSCLPKLLPVADRNMPYSVVTTASTYSATNSLITGIEHRDTGTMEYYAFGTGLFYSDNGGARWIYFHQLADTSASPISGSVSGRKIVKFDYATVGMRYIALTVTATKGGASITEIWVAHWGQPNLYNLYPSYEWEMSLLLLPPQKTAGTKSLYTRWNSAGTTVGSRQELGVFFDSLGDLKQIFAFKEDSSWNFVTLDFPINELIPAMYSAKIEVFTDARTATLPDSGNECPSMTVKLRNRQAVERLEYFRYFKPQTRQEDYYQLPEVATVYATTLRSISAFIIQEFNSNYTTAPPGYSEQVSVYFNTNNHSNKWQYEKIVARSDPRRIMIMKEDFQCISVEDQSVLFHDFPDHIYVDRLGHFTIVVSLYDIKPTGGFGLTDIAGLPKVGFHLVNGSLLQGSVVLKYDATEHVASYEPVYEATVYVGCRPSLKLQFDWTLLVDTKAPSYTDCSDVVDHMPCVTDTEGTPVPIYLRLVDHATNMGTNFSGKFRLYVVGFSYGPPTNMTRFPADQVEQYNILSADGSNSQKLIWDTNNTEQVELEKRSLSIGRNFIIFTCQPDSPCGSNLTIGLFDEPHLNFLIRVTNKDMPNNETYCIFDLEFVVRIRGAKPNPYSVHLATFLGTLVGLFALKIAAADGLDDDFGHSNKASKVYGRPHSIAQRMSRQ
ncbi:hypothetical protein BV898_05152 [Hypsibius exemplaris]|uniref:CATSPERG C-terminal domain-containing protein n=1 Tax=Hypsibius exemplaris TaxID=2072580 RepID=A0A1W0X012_HYPEX|nr:hypothetical protein BV898_05152 [Hypsibius exemplaris]